MLLETSKSPAHSTAKGVAPVTGGAQAARRFVLVIIFRILKTSGHLWHLQVQRASRQGSFVAPPLAAVPHQQMHAGQGTEGPTQHSGSGLRTTQPMSFVAEASKCAMRHPRAPRERMPLHVLDGDPSDCSGANAALNL